MMTGRNIHFSILIRINKKLHEFNFRQRSPELFDADTGDERGNRYYFKIVNEEASWKIKGINLPDWISNNEIAIIDGLVNGKRA